MATTKKTPAKKAPKKQHEPVAKKPQPKVEQLAIPNKPEPAVAPEEEKVRFVIPRDPSMESGDQFWECSLNGVNYRFRRGVELTQPKWLYDYIASKLYARERISPFVAEFQNTSKKLN